MPRPSPARRRSARPSRVPSRSKLHYDLIVRPHDQRWGTKKKAETLGLLTPGGVISIGVEGGLILAFESQFHFCGGHTYFPHFLYLFLYLQIPIYLQPMNAFSYFVPFPDLIPLSRCSCLVRDAFMWVICLLSYLRCLLSRPGEQPRSIFPRCQGRVGKCCTYSILNGQEIR